MFLISKFAYEAMIKSQARKKITYLKIHNYSPEHHKQTFYKFRYGAPDIDGEVGEPSPITLKRGAYFSIWSLEGFELSERVIAIFGHSSTLFRRGLELINSPFIDPSFQGQLQLTIRNFSNQEVILSPGDTIGKITFFDISDTILSVEDLIDEVQKSATNIERQKAIHELSQALGKISKD